MRKARRSTRFLLKRSSPMRRVLTKPRQARNKIKLREVS